MLLSFYKIVNNTNKIFFYILYTALAESISIYIFLFI